MERISKHLSIYMPPVRLYLEDLNEIEAVFRGNCKTYYVETDDYKLDGLVELQKLTNPVIIGLSFSGRDPYISLELANDAARIYSAADDVVSQGIVSKIESVLRKRVTPLRYFFSFRNMMIANVLYWLLPLGIPSGAFRAYGLFMLVGFLFITGIIGIFGYRLEKHRYSLVYLINRTSRTNFFLRNRDQLILLLLGAITGGLATFFVELLIKRNSP